MVKLCSGTLKRKQYFCISLSILIVILVILTPIQISSANDGLQQTQINPLQNEWSAIGSNVGHLRFEHLGVRQGLSENSILAILQDSVGFLWVGTRDGLNKFDGNEFISFQADPLDAGSISDSHITALAETSDSSLWVGTYNGGLNRYDCNNHVFEAFTADSSDPSALPDNRITALFEDSDGNLWVGTRGGLSVLNLNHWKFTHFQHDPDLPDSLSSNVVQAIIEDSSGKVWIGTDNGLNLINSAEQKFSKFLIDENADLASVRSISDDGQGGLWLGTNGGLIHFDPAKQNYQVFQHQLGNPDTPSSNHVNAVIRDREGNLWVGFEDSGVDLMKTTADGNLTVMNFSHQDDEPDSLSQNKINVIFEDQSGLMWFGTHGGGLNKANPLTQAFGYIPHILDDSNTPSDDISALAFDAARQSLWIGTAGAGLARMDLVTGEFVHYRHDPDDDNSLENDFVNLLHIGPTGDLYVGTANGPISVFDPATDGFLAFLAGIVGNSTSTTVTAVTHDTEGMLWLVGISGDLLQVDPSGEVIGRYNITSAISGARMGGDILLRDIYVDGDGIIWLATMTHGLIRFDRETNEAIILDADGTTRGPSHSNITVIHADGDEGLLWLGTEGGGLNRYDLGTGEFSYTTTRDGLPSNQIFGIQPDEFGYLWLSTGNGLVRFSPDSGLMSSFDVRDGLQGDTFTHRADVRSDDGALFFGGSNGLNAFYPREIHQNDEVPPIVITSVSLFNEIIATDLNGCFSSLTLTHDQNFLSFTYSALDFTDPGKNQYAYILEGLNDDYVNVGTLRHADFPDLAWGKYTFRVVGSNNDGVWNTSGACLEIEIRPPFWAAWWFIGLVGLLLAVIVVMGYRWRLNSIKEQRQSLAVEVFERTMEIENRRQMALGLSEVVRLLNTNHPLEKSLEFIVQQSVGLTSASKAAIFERKGHWVEAQACYPEGETYPVDLNNPDSASAHCLLDSTFLNRLLIYSRIDPKTMQSDTNWELVSGEYRTILCTPLIVEDEVYGGLVLYYGEDRTFTPDEIDLANTLADQASLAIANEQLKRKAQDAAVTAERNRLARDLHDAVTQTLFSTSLIAEVLPKIWKKDPEQALLRLDELRQLTRGALGEMRTLLMALRPEMPKNHQSQGQTQKLAH